MSSAMILPGWKSPLELDAKQQQRGSASFNNNKMNNKIQRRRNSQRRKDKKGDFVKRMSKHGDAPNLMSVVTAKSSIKQRAAKEAVVREQKNNVKKKLMGRKKIVKRHPIKQRDNQWTSALTGQHVVGKVSKNIPARATKRHSSFNEGSSQRRTSLSPMGKRTSRNRIPISRSHSFGSKPSRATLSSATTTTKTTATTDTPSVVRRRRKKKDKTTMTDAESTSTAKKKKMKKKKDKTLTDNDSSTSSKKRKKKKKTTIPKPRVIPNFVDQHADDLASIAERSRQKGSGTSMDRSGRSEYNTIDQSERTELTSHDDDDESESESESERSEVVDPVFLPKSMQKANKQILLEFELPDQQGTGLQLSVDLETVGDMSSIESWPSIESDDSYDTRMNKMMQRWMDLNIEFDDDDDDDENKDDGKTENKEEEKSNNNNTSGVELDDNVLDHIVLASSNMEDALDTFEKLTGVRPVVMGPLEGLGIQTAQVGMDKGRYIEIIAPDYDNPGPLCDELKVLPPGRVIPYQYAIRATEISRLIEGYVYDVLGWDPDHICMVQKLPDGTSSRQWDLLTMYGHNIGGAAPIYVRYPDPSEHPTAKLLEPKITFEKFTIQADRDHRVHKLITDVGGIDIEYAQTPALEFKFHTPKGGRAMSCDYPQGLVFPGFKQADHGSTKKTKTSSKGKSSKKKSSSGK